MILGALLSLLFSATAMAQVPPICSNLSAVTCSGGERNDGTGISYRSDTAEYAKREWEQIKPSIDAGFQSLLNTADGASLRAPAAEACRLNQYAECRDINSESCKPKMVSCLSRLFRAAEKNPDLGILYDTAREESSLFDAEKALSLVQHPTYVRTAQAIGAKHKAAIPQELKTKVEKQIFPDVQALLRKRIAELPIDDQTRQKLDQRISTIKFGGIECQAVSMLGEEHVVDYSTRLHESLYPNAQYDRTKNQFQICPAFLKHSTSEFDLAATIAHELAHSIDPCGLGGGPMELSRAPISEAKSDKEIEDSYLRKDFLTCFRSPASIEAKEYRLIDPPVADAEGMYADDLNRLCQEDQINETISDWFAAETIAAYIPSRNARVKPPLTQDQVRTGMSNIYRGFCSNEAPGEKDTHPPTPNRLNGIYLMQPKIRALMGCPATVPGKKYCDIQNPASLTGSGSAPASRPSNSNGTRQ